MAFDVNAVLEFCGSTTVNAVDSFARASAIQDSFARASALNDLFARAPQI